MLRDRFGLRRQVFATPLSFTALGSAKAASRRLAAAVQMSHASRFTMVTPASQARRVCEARWMGLVPYNDGLRLQERTVERLRSGDAPEQLLLLEHSHVFTLGRGADSSNILADQQHLESNSVEVHET